MKNRLHGSESKWSDDIHILEFKQYVCNITFFRGDKALLHVDLIVSELPAKLN